MKTCPMCGNSERDMIAWAHDHGPDMIAWAHDHGLGLPEVESMIASEQCRPNFPEPVKVKMICQGWEESERGWGVRPDGYSLHKDLDACMAFRKAYWDKMPKDEVPDEYSRESGTPFECELDASDPRVKEALEGHNGTGSWFWDYNKPAGAKDGWIPVKQ